MRYDSKSHHRRSIRLKGYDYTQSGACFVSITTQNRECFFGSISKGQLQLNEAGLMVQRIWDEMPAHYPGFETDAFIVMPNHIHGIIVCVGATTRGCPLSDPDSGQAQGPAPTYLSLPDVIHRLKTLTTKQYTDGVKLYDWPVFHGRLWQRNYYEHIIRNERELARIRHYIRDNPVNWLFDRENISGKSRPLESDSSEHDESWCI